MSVKNWETVKICYCQHLKQDVGFEVLVVQPADLLPDQPGRVSAHRCSRGVDCSLDDKAACMWAGTNPAVDPFSE